MNLESWADRFFVMFTAQHKSQSVGWVAEPTAIGSSAATIAPSQAALAAGQPQGQTGDTPDTALGAGWY